MELTVMSMHERLKAVLQAQVGQRIVEMADKGTGALNWPEKVYTPLG